MEEATDQTRMDHGLEGTFGKGWPGIQGRGTGVERRIRFWCCDCRRDTEDGPGEPSHEGPYGT